ncbi:MAG: type VI secretion system baseplate subunit TssG [Proteobacteria bacterium]|nr:type VI secretion system baseplate subunit TssG [Pseudomonadota bacterium]
MALYTRNAHFAIKNTLKEKTFQFDFHQAVELLEQMQPDAIPLGEGSDPTKEALVIKTRVSLSPSSSEIHSFTPPSANQNQPIIWVNFLGIAGIQGPFPTPYTELLLERTRQNDMGFRDFLDIFNHRVASLWHRLKKRTFISYSQKDPRYTDIGKCLLSISGLSNKSYRNSLFVSDRTLLSYHDLFWRRPRSAYGLVKLLSSHYKLNVTIDQNQGAWEKADDAEITRLGVTEKAQFNVLGQTAIVGNKLWNQAAGIRINIGPMTWQQMSHFLPITIKDSNNKNISGRDFKTLKDLITFYLGTDLRIKMRLYVHPFNVKPLRLNRQFSLGHNSWLTVGKTLKTPCFTDVVLVH